MRLTWTIGAAIALVMYIFMLKEFGMGIESLHYLVSVFAFLILSNLEK